MIKETRRKIAMEGFISNLLSVIKDSPLGKIQGECRFTNCVPGDIENGGDNFFNECNVSINFAYGSKMLGCIIPRQENVESIQMKNGEINDSYNIALVFNKPNVVCVFIQFTDAWPHLSEFGEFIAFLPDVR